MSRTWLASRLKYQNMARFSKSTRRKFFFGRKALSNGAPSAKFARCDFRLWLQKLKSTFKRGFGFERSVGLKMALPILGLLAIEINHR
jgi:hypothetical protein